MLLWSFGVLLLTIEACVICAIAAPGNTHEQLERPYFGIEPLHAADKEILLLPRHDANTITVKHDNPKADHIKSNRLPSRNKNIAMNTDINVYINKLSRNTKPSINIGKKFVSESERAKTNTHNPRLFYKHLLDKREIYTRHSITKPTLSKVDRIAVDEKHNMELFKNLYACDVEKPVVFDVTTDPSNIEDIHRRAKEKNKTVKKEIINAGIGIGGFVSQLETIKTAVKEDGNDTISNVKKKNKTFMKEVFVTPSIGSVVSQLERIAKATDKDGTSNTNKRCNAIVSTKNKEIVNVGHKTMKLLAYKLPTDDDLGAEVLDPEDEALIDHNIIEMWKDWIPARHVAPYV